MRLIGKTAVVIGTASGIGVARWRIPATEDAVVPVDSLKDDPSRIAVAEVRVPATVGATVPRSLLTVDRGRGIR